MPFFITSTGNEAFQVLVYGIKEKMSCKEPVRFLGLMHDF